MSEKVGMNGDMLIPLESILKVLNNLENNQIIQYEGCLGTQAALMSTPCQILELKIVFKTKSGVSDGQNTEQDGSSGN